MEPKTGEIFGQKELVGHWIVVDPSLTRVLAAAKTPEAALHQAGIDPHGKTQDARPVLMQVSDPALTCLF